MAANSFGLVAENVRAHHFPNADAWTTSSRPSSTIVAEKILEKAGKMAGWLALQLIDASTITTNSSAYYHCREVLRMEVAYVLARDMLGGDAAVVTSWEKAVALFYKELAAPGGGADFLGDGAAASGTSDADGPHSHISVYDLEQDTAENMSSVIPKLRMDDDT